MNLRAPMVEYLALPATEVAPTAVEAWVAQLTEAGGPVEVERESKTVSWLEVRSLRLRGYVVLENNLAAAINFELHDRDPAPALQAITTAATALGWEIHADDDDDDPDQEQDDDE